MLNKPGRIGSKCAGNKIDIDTKTQKAVNDVEFVYALYDLVKQHAPDSISSRFCDAVNNWMHGGSKFDKELGIVSLSGSDSTPKLYWLFKRNAKIQEAGILCKRETMDATSLKIAYEIEVFRPIWEKQFINGFNANWTGVQTILAWSFLFHDKYKPHLAFPLNKNSIRKILLKHQHFS